MKRLHIILDNIRSAYNVGSIFRTADAINDTKLYLCGMAAYPPNKKIEKTALGATKSVDWQYFDNTLKAIKKVQSLNIPVFAAEITKTSLNYSTVTYPDPVAIVFGHEVNGVSEFVIKNAEKNVHIPMQGLKKSLNVATAAGIIMFEAIKD